MRPRQKDRHLPKAMYFKHGRYWHVVNGKWHKLSTDYAEALSQYGRRTGPKSGIAPLIDRVLEREDLKPNTRAQYAICTDRIKNAFAEFEPHEVTPSDIGQFLDHHRKTPAMANRMRTVLKTAFEMGVRAGLAPSNPVRDIKPFKENKRRRYLSDEEYIAIKAQLNPQMQLIMDLAYLTAARIGDILALKRSDIHGDTVYFEQQKTENRVEITADGVADIAAQAKGLRKFEAITLFHNGRGGLYSYTAARDCFRRACQKAGIEDVQFRDIRAKSATDAEEQGLDPTRLLGHADARTTKIYLRNKKIIRGVGPRSIRQVSN